MLRGTEQNSLSAMFVLSCLAILIVALGLELACVGQVSGPIRVKGGGPWKRASQPSVLPGWAVYLPEDLNEYLIAVGYSRLARPERSLGLAVRNGYENLARAYHVHITSRRWEIFEGRFRFPIEHADERIDSTVFEMIKTQAVVLDTFEIKGSSRNGSVRTYVLVSLSTVSIPPELRRAQPPGSSGPPSWFHEVPKKPGYEFGVGVCGYYKDVADSWSAAEGLARLDLAFQMGVKAGSIHMDRQGSIKTTSGFLDQKVDADLHNVVIIARHYDPKEEKFYVLARIPSW